jgi:hypothetical protein
MSEDISKEPLFKYLTEKLNQFALAQRMLGKTPWERVEVLVDELVEVVLPGLSFINGKNSVETRDLREDKFSLFLRALSLAGEPEFLGHYQIAIKCWFIWEKLSQYSFIQEEGAFREAKGILLSKIAWNWCYLENSEQQKEIFCLLLSAKEVEEDIWEVVLDAIRQNDSHCSVTQKLLAISLISKESARINPGQEGSESDIVTFGNLISLEKVLLKGWVKSGDILKLSYLAQIAAVFPDGDPDDPVVEEALVIAAKRIHEVRLFADKVVAEIQEKYPFKTELLWVGVNELSLTVLLQSGLGNEEIWKIHNVVRDFLKEDTVLLQWFEERLVGADLHCFFHVKSLVGGAFSSVNSKIVFSHQAG